MAAFDVFALSSRWEGLGLVLLEAMSRGVPIAATRGGAIPEVLAGGELGLLSDVGDAAGLRRNIRALWEDPALRADFAERGKRAVRDRYSVSAMVNATMKVYTDRLDTGDRRADNENNVSYTFPQDGGG
jgi:glycosyltransferase involved in cell wall biosynthesis